MRLRCIPAILLVVTIAGSDAQAQVCNGAPSLRNRHARVGTSVFGSGDTLGYDAFVTVGYREFYFTGAIGRTKYDPWEDSYDSFDVGVGYAFHVTPRVSLCPRGSVGVRIGPDNILDFDADYRATDVSVGVTVGMIATPDNARVGVVPFGSLGLGRTNHNFEGVDAAFFGSSRSDMYGRIAIGVGLIIGDATIRPTLSVPFDVSEGSGPASFGVSLSFTF